MQAPSFTLDALQNVTPQPMSERCLRFPALTNLLCVKGNEDLSLDLLPDFRPNGAYPLSLQPQQPLYYNCLISGRQKLSVVHTYLYFLLHSWAQELLGLQTPGQRAKSTVDAKTKKREKIAMFKTVRSRQGFCLFLTAFSA